MAEHSPLQLLALGLMFLKFSHSRGEDISCYICYAHRARIYLIQRAKVNIIFRTTADFTFFYIIRCEKRTI